ncbi:MAG: transposase, partial [Planctomycetaceae bacterium]|nr:transposase [Planctomycetaceae bacterium]
MASSFAATQATWRFLNNERVTPQELVKPLRMFAKTQFAKTTVTGCPGEGFVLLVSDWSKLKYGDHRAKKDVVRLTHETNIGYELTTHLLVNAQNGQPIAPLEMHLRTAEKVHSTRDEPVEDANHTERILPTMNASKNWGLAAKMVHVIDRETDSVGHWRQWNAAGHKFLVRGNNRRVTWQNSSVMMNEVAQALGRDDCFRRTRDVEIRGRRAYQEIAETTVTLDRPARHKINGKQKQYPGETIELRFVMTRIRDVETHELLSEWYLLTNIDATSASSELIALWHYWRWNIESYFKLMKSAGMKLDHWQQESGYAIMNRLLVASMAAATIWSLQRTTGNEATEFKDLLVKLSGKTVKRTRPHTCGALLSGLFVLLRILDFLEQVDFDVDKIAKIQNQLKRF